MMTPKRPKVDKTSLVGIALNQTVNGFEKNPFKVESRLNAEMALTFFDRLQTDIDYRITSIFVENEEYWKRACENVTFCVDESNEEHGLSFKRMLFELQIQDIVKNSEEILKPELISDVISPFSDYIHTLQLSCVPHGFPIDMICCSLPNLTQIDLNYEEIRRSDNARFKGVPKAIKSSLFLTTLVLQKSKVTDDDIFLIFNDLTNSKLIHLDLSHNNITSRGLKQITDKFIAPPESIMCAIDLTGNKICRTGGIQLGQGLRTNVALLALNLRLNNLGDQGGQALFKGLIHNRALRRLNVSANRLGSSSATALSCLLRSRVSGLEMVILSSNHFTEEDASSLSQHKKCFVDVRKGA